jgi:SAM-dependent methyltransferase
VVTRAERARSFGTVAEDYDRLRPGPPPAAIRWLLPDGCATAVDLAAGTGLVSRAVAGQAGRVVAVEPDPRMAAVLRARSPGVAVLRGVGEAIPLADASADAVLISSAWHWLDPARAIPELARVLRAGGRLCVLRSGIDQDAGWLRELRHPDRSGRDQQLRDASGSYQTLPRTGQFGHAAQESFSFTRTMSPGELVDLLATYSQVITASEPDRAEGLGWVRSELDRLFPGGGPIEVPMRTRCWRADRAGLAPAPSQVDIISLPR